MSARPTYHYPEDFAPPPPPTSVYVFCGVVLTMALGAISAWAGLEYGLMLCREARKAELNVRPTCANPPASYIVPIQECSRVCRARWRSTRTGQ